ncbi:MAG: hypothetical protein AVDCRST_MAG50-706 [uncultured Acidimicrobiales bacterium]|uniref:Uncharacterized protein n=1 Tax=uncultured Acidimicrobiales bacterium TaxID=310071 RepID=A0A6J4HHP2_9ACTN|nr:MAG: hypothetical protein AVDCRST_MAG50-706 [uncultured Acidimicrobiales bacterium]
MATALRWTDRLRIERAVWALDQRLYDLPRSSRIAKRREVRESLISASHDIGTAAALQRLGNSRQLAAEYLSAELGDEGRPHWFAAGVFLFTGQLVLTSLLTDAAAAFAAGITTATPDATGTFEWAGIAYLQDTVRYTFVNGEATWVGGAWTPLAWLLWLTATVVVGRLWRVKHMLRLRRNDPARLSAP